MTPTTTRRARITAAAASLVVAGGLACTALPGHAASARAAAPTCFGKAATIVGTPQADEIVGTPGPDVIVGLNGPDRIEGRGGDDRICGGGRRDLVDGGQGDDLLTGDVGPDEVAGGAGDDVVLGGADTPGDRTASRGDLLTGGVGADRVFGDLRTPTDADQLYGDVDTVSYEDASVPIRAADVRPAVTLDGTTIRVGAGRDRVHGVTRIVGTPFDDTLRTTGDVGAGPILSGGDGDDLLEGVESYGGAGDDRLVGETYTAGFGADLFGGPGDDVMTSDGRYAVVVGGPGADSGATTGLGAELRGGPGPDRLVMEGSALVLTGGGADVVVGGPENDYVYVNRGDRVRAGDGNDIVRLTDGTVPAVIKGGAGDDRLNAGDLIERRPGDEVDTARVTMDFVDDELTYRGRTSVASSFEEYYAPMAQPNVVIGSDADETILTGCRADRIAGGGGDDVIRPMLGDDVVRGGPGNDTVGEGLVSYPCKPYGRTDDDSLSGGTGTDHLLVVGPGDGGSGPSSRTVDLAEGFSTVRGDDRLESIENVTGTLEGDVLRGDEGPNVIDGGQGGGADRLYGLGGDDRVVTAGADRGDNLADGGAGDDTCRARTVRRCEQVLED